MADMKKVAMAGATARLLAGITWLPALLRMPTSDQERKVATGRQGSNVYFAGGAIMAKPGPRQAAPRL